MSRAPDLAAELRATRLVRSFGGPRPAVDDVSLLVTPGKPVGLLGRNGAGKTTTLRILAGYLPPTSGTVTVAGVDLARHPRRAKALLGYLPENVPLYGELRVDELLRHRSALRGLGARSAARIDDVVASCGLGDVRRRIIGQLSKGFRQRVGLADALLAAPPVLLLDEPTDGLDPAQRAELLAHIAELARTSAVLLSSHVLDEIESVCGRVVILSQGKVVADGLLDELSAPAFAVEVRGPMDAIVAALRAVPTVLLVTPRSDTRLIVQASRDAADALARAVIGVGELRALSAVGLRERFAELTGSAA